MTERNFIQKGLDWLKNRKKKNSQEHRRSHWFFYPPEEALEFGGSGNVLIHPAFYAKEVEGRLIEVYRDGIKVFEKENNVWKDVETCLTPDLQTQTDRLKFMLNNSDINLN